MGATTTSTQPTPAFEGDDDEESKSSRRWRRFWYLALFAVLILGSSLWARLTGAMVWFGRHSLIATGDVDFAWQEQPATVHRISIWAGHDGYRFDLTGARREEYFRIITGKRPHQGTFVVKRQQPNVPRVVDESYSADLRIFSERSLFASDSGWVELTKRGKFLDGSYLFYVSERAPRDPDAPRRITLEGHFRVQ